MEYDLVFEGGGAKGMVFVGAMDEFYRRGHTSGRLMGTSAGAITAALTAAGYTTEEMLSALAEKDADGKPVFAGFMAAPGSFPADPSELLRPAQHRLRRLTPGSVEAAPGCAAAPRRRAHGGSSSARNRSHGDHRPRR